MLARYRLLAKRSLAPLRLVIPINAYLAKPISAWPAIVGVIHDIRVPRGIWSNPTPSPLGSANINIIFELIDRTAAVAGDLAECGVFRGATLVSTAIYLRERAIRKRVFGFDSFAGFDQTVEKDIARGGTADEFRRRGGYSETSVSVVSAKLRRFGVEAGVTLVPGYFQDTLGICAQSRFSFVHLDCDTYDAYHECLPFFYQRMNPGGIILFDEYNDTAWPGCNLAVDEFLAGKPEKVQLIMRDNFQKFYIEVVNQQTNSV